MAGSSPVRSGLPRRKRGCNSNTEHESPRGATGDGMAYIITATNLVGAISLRRDAPVAALKKALELVEQGMMNVSITDEQGRQYEPAEFDRLHGSGKVG
jgi:hypothetical protein